jgi:hypothetical protein
MCKEHNTREYALSSRFSLWPCPDRLPKGEHQTSRAPHHPNVWKVDSTIFASTGFSEVSQYSLPIEAVLLPQN